MTGLAVPTATLTLGRCDEMRAEVLVRVETSHDVSRCAISGTLSGPHRGRDTTLPVSARLQPTTTPGLFRVILTEPAYWTPDLPNLYRLVVAVDSGDVPLSSIDRLVGLRRLGVRGRSFWLDGRRWVPRAVSAEGIAGIDACKPATLAALVTDPDEATLARADETGVAVLAIVPATATDAMAIADRIAAWSAHPSAVLAILPMQIPAAIAAAVVKAANDRKGTLLLAASASGTAAPPTVILSGIDALVVALDESTMPNDGWRHQAALPLVAWRNADAPPETGRAPCDALQAAIAAWGTTGKPDSLPWDWAGYVVG